MHTMKENSKSKEIIWLITTKDKYELPLFAGTCKEAAAYLNTTEASIRSAWSHYKNGERKRPAAYKIYI